MRMELFIYALEIIKKFSQKWCKRIKHKLEAGKKTVSWVVSHCEGGLVSLMKRSQMKKIPRHPQHCGASLRLQMLRQTRRSIIPAIVYSCQGLQTHHAHAVPTTSAQSACARCNFDWEVVGSASLYLHQFHSWINRNMRDRAKTEPEWDHLKELQVMEKLEEKQRHENVAGQKEKTTNQQGLPGTKNDKPWCVIFFFSSMHLPLKQCIKDLLRRGRRKDTITQWTC